MLVKDTTTDFAGTYDDQHYYVKDVLIVTRLPGVDAPDLRVLVAVINSKALRFYYRTTFQTIHVQAEELASLPIPAFKNPEAHDRLVRLAEQIIEARNRLAQVHTDKDRQFYESKYLTLDHEIDRQVYEAYGLSQADVRIIEQGVAAARQGSGEPDANRLLTEVDA